MKNIFWAGVFLSGFGVLLMWHERTVVPSESVPIIRESAPAIVTESRSPVVPEVSFGMTTTNEVPLPRAVLIPAVPFTVQAPFAQWGDPLFQDACEEAAIIMAAAWVGGTTLTKEWVADEVRTLETFEKKQFGQAIDTSITDTAWLLDQYYGITGQVQTGIAVTDIERMLAENKIVIVPTDGRRLKNSHFRQPGPIHHMVVIIGYDAEAGTFIVNDPGTRNGKGYRYAQSVLYDAISNYATGNHALVTSTDKVMLAVGKK